MHTSTPISIFIFLITYWQEKPYGKLRTFKFLMNRQEPEFKIAPGAVKENWYLLHYNPITDQAIQTEILCHHWSNEQTLCFSVKFDVSTSTQTFYLYCSLCYGIVSAQTVIFLVSPTLHFCPCLISLFHFINRSQKNGKKFSHPNSSHLVHHLDTCAFEQAPLFFDTLLVYRTHSTLIIEIELADDSSLACSLQTWQGTSHEKFLQAGVLPLVWNANHCVTEVVPLCAISLYICVVMWK